MLRLLTVSLFIFLSFGVIATAKILFKTSSGIYTMDDGSNITTLTEGEQAGYARWNPNGKKILFRKQVRNAIGTGYAGYAFFLMDTDGTNQQQITKTTEFHKKMNLRDREHSHPMADPLFLITVSVCRLYTDTPSKIVSDNTISKVAR